MTKHIYLFRSAWTHPQRRACFFCLKYGVVSALACSPRHVVLKPAGIRHRGVLKFERVVAGSCGVQSLDCHAGRALLFVVRQPSSRFLFGSSTGNHVGRSL